MNLHTVPATVKAGGTVFESHLDVMAQFVAAEPDVGLRAGFDIDSIKLTITKHLRCKLVSSIRVQVHDHAPAWVEVDPAALAKLDTIELDDEVLMDEINSYLLKDMK